MGTFEGQKFDEGIAELKRFMKERLAWMDEQFVSVEILQGILRHIMPIQPDLDIGSGSVVRTGKW